MLPTVRHASIMTIRPKSNSAFDRNKVIASIESCLTKRGIVFEPFTFNMSGFSSYIDFAYMLNGDAIVMGKVREDIYEPFAQEYSRRSFGAIARSQVGNKCCFVLTDGIDFLVSDSTAQGFSQPVGQSVAIDIATGKARLPEMQKVPVLKSNVEARSVRPGRKVNENSLLDSLPIGSVVCRYTSLKSIFATIQNQSYRLFSLASMNDKSEGIFLSIVTGDENYSKPEYVASKRSEWFISSCSPECSRDDLTMFRLYGDKAQGVCLVFEVDFTSDNFWISPITYLDLQDIDKSPSKTKLAKWFRKNNIDEASVNDFSVLPFFVKSSLFSVESEIRLLFRNLSGKTGKNEVVKNSDWVLDNTNSIPNRYVDINKDAFPLRLKEIVIGPKRDESEIIKAQLEKMLVFYGWNKEGAEGVKVSVSDIKIYR